MWENWSLSALLAGKSKGIAAVKSTSAVKKLNIQMPRDPAIPVLSICIVKRTRNRYSNKYLYMNVHRNTIHNTKM